MVKFIFGFIFLNLILWNIFVPIFELPSEQLYFHRVYEVYTTKKLPNLRDAQIGDLIYPDTYPILLVPIMAVFNPPSIFYPGTRIFDPQVIQHLSPQRGRFNRFFHPPSEKNFHWNNLAWSIHTMRFATSLIYLLAVWITYKTAQKLFTTSYMPQAILLFVGFHSKMIHRATSLVNLPLLFLSFSLFFYFALTRPPSRTTSFLLGLSAGLGVITKITGYNLVIFFLSYLFFFIKPFRQQLHQILPFSLGYLLIAGWYHVRNFSLYQHPLAAMFLQPPTPAEVVPILGSQLNYWYAIVTTTWQTFWDGFGWENILFPRFIHWSVNLLTLMAIWGVIAYLKKSPHRLQLQLKFLFTALTIFIAAFLLVNLKFFTPQGKDFMPMLLPIVLVYILGLNWWWHRSPLKSVHLPVTLLSLILFTLNVLFLLLSVTPKTLGEQNISPAQYYQRIQPGPLHRWLLSIWKSL